MSNKGGFLFFVRFVVLIMSGWALWIAFSFTPEYPPPDLTCLVKKITGHECPACGITRGLTALAHGRFLDAFHYYPFVFPVFFGLFIALTGALLPNSIWKRMMNTHWIPWSLGLGAGLTGLGIIVHWLIRVF
ncbi:DUF2752 domain-containing protein [bacterium]|nr:DUF2752 domain-containing protein [bacterium]